MFDVVGVHSSCEHPCLGDLTFDHVAFMHVEHRGPNAKKEDACANKWHKKLESQTRCGAR
jgi:hypothetical protein